MRAPAAQKGQPEGRKLSGTATVTLSSDVSPVLMGTVSQGTKMRGSTRRNLSHNPALFWVPTSTSQGRRHHWVLRCSGHRGNQFERQPQISARLGTWGPAPVETGWLVPRRLKGWDSKRSTFRAPLKLPLLWLPPGPDFPPPSLGLSLRSMLRVEALCKQRGQRLYVNQPRHLPARFGSARTRSKAERTKTSASHTGCPSPASNLFTDLARSSHTTVRKVLSRLLPPRLRKKNSENVSWRNFTFKGFHE
ncbi:uncharacterized protein LOC110321240 [Mus pahari]|uniref:uncharacterized protein LOC110321240 n=1 Tax=Mus pahari TaxID=10093 RepID=UPI000A306BFA|nr:uncharacterized protein LOC110321240 [Mus pahari]